MSATKRLWKPRSFFFCLELFCALRICFLGALRKTCCATKLLWKPFFFLGKKESDVLAKRLWKLRRRMIFSYSMILEPGCKCTRVNVLEEIQYIISTMYWSKSSRALMFFCFEEQDRAKREGWEWHRRMMLQATKP